MKKKIIPWFMITVGCLLASLGYVVLAFPLQLFEGGVTGLGMIFNHAFGFPIGITSLVLTLIIFSITSKIIGKSFGIKSIYATILVYSIIDILSLFNIPKITNDILLASFYGAISIGIGLGIVFYYGAATGGGDAIAQTLKKIYHIPIGRTFIVIDVVVLGIAIQMIGIEKVMYSFLFIFLQAKVVDMVLNGLEANQKITIITEHPNEIKNEILNQLERGITIYESFGAYTGNKKTTLITVVPKKETQLVKKIIADIDVKVFVIIENVHQVYGEGFISLLKKRKNI